MSANSPRSANSPDGEQAKPPKLTWADAGFAARELGRHMVGRPSIFNSTDEQLEAHRLTQEANAQAKTLAKQARASTKAARPNFSQVASAVLGSMSNASINAASKTPIAGRAANSMTAQRLASAQARRADGAAVPTYAHAPLASPVTPYLRLANYGVIDHATGPREVRMPPSGRIERARWLADVALNGVIGWVHSVALETADTALPNFYQDAKSSVAAAPRPDVVTVATPTPLAPITAPAPRYVTYQHSVEEEPVPDGRGFAPDDASTHGQGPIQNV